MKILRDCWAALLELFNVVTLSPTLQQPSSQQALQTDLGLHLPNAADGGPVFPPPSHPQNPDTLLKCDYSPMGKEWVACSTNHSRACWIAGPAGEEYNIRTNYEEEFPTGITRKVISPLYPIL